MEGTNNMDSKGAHVLAAQAAEFHDQMVDMVGIIVFGLIPIVSIVLVGLMVIIANGQK
jgi:hypothetical protein